MNEAQKALLDGLASGIAEAHVAHRKTSRQLFDQEIQRYELEARLKAEKALLDSMIQVRKTLVKQYTNSTTGAKS